MEKGRLIEQYLKRKGISQAQFAKICGVSQTAISKHITGQRKISAASAIAYEGGSGGELRAVQLLGIKAA